MRKGAKSRAVEERRMGCSRVGRPAARWSSKVEGARGPPPTPADSRYWNSTKLAGSPIYLEFDRVVFTHVGREGEPGGRRRRIGAKEAAAVVPPGSPGGTTPAHPGRRPRASLITPSSARVTRQETRMAAPTPSPPTAPAKSRGTCGGKGWVERPKRRDTVACGSCRGRGYHGGDQR